MFEELDRAIYKPINHITGEHDKDNVNYGKTVTIISGMDVLGNYRISVDDFPQCNGRKQKNWFYANEEELEEVVLVD